MSCHFLPPGCGDGPHIVLFQVVADHAQHDWIVFDNKNPRRLIVGRARAKLGSVERRGSVSAASVEI
jgi:hypothetical protein